jgi:4-hydroxyphenylpyruvate dioxygenase and related hemolysins
MPDPTVASQPDVETPEDFLPINGTDYVEFYVGNAKQAAQYYAHLFGFQIQGYLGPETGHDEKVSYLLRQNDIRFVLTSALGPDSPISEHVRRHGDGVKDIAMWVDDAAASFEETTKRGAEAVQGPTVHEDDDGRIVTATIETYGDTVHTFVERSDYDGLFFPGFENWDNEFWEPPAPLV